MRELPRHLYRTYQHGPAPHCRGPASCCGEHVAPKCGVHYLLFLEEDCDDVLVGLQPHGMAMMSQDIVKSVNRILKVGYNNHSDCGGGCGEHPTHRKACAVAQVWELWFLQFDLPLHTRGVPNAGCWVVSNLIDPGYFTSHSHAPLPTFSSIFSAWTKAPPRR